MPRKCPPGVICIENITLIFLIAAVTLGIILYLKLNKPDIPIIIPPRAPPPSPPRRRPIPQIQRQPPSVLLNPYVPPLRNTNVYSSNWGIPINIKTRGYNAAYRQVGILTRVNGAETILPLMGRPLHANRNKWQYYTMSDKNNSVKLPISRKGRSCTNEYGCDEIYNGDTVYAEGYNDAFKVTMYDNQMQQYIPFI